MLRNRYCDRETRLANLIVVEGDLSFVNLPTHTTTDIHFARRTLNSTVGPEWPFGKVFVLAHEWVHKCDSIPHREWKQHREGLTDLIAWDVSRRICRLESRGCLGGRFREHSGYYKLTVRYRRAGPKPWTGADARRWRRAELQRY